MEDRDLVRAMIAGDRAAWEHFLRAFGPVLVRAAAAVLARSDMPAESGDVAQKVLALLLEGDRRLLRSFQGRSSLSTWLIGIARRQALMTLREERRKPPEPAPAPARTPLDEAASAESAERLAAALASLASRERLLLKLHYDDGLPYDRIAATLGVSINSVSPLLERARARLRAAIGKK